MQSKVRHTLDAGLILQGLSSSAITSSAASTLVPVDRITGSPRGALNGAYGNRKVDVVVHVVALDHTTGDETYTLNISAYDAAGANQVVVETVVVTASNVGQTLVFPVDMQTFGKYDTNGAQIGIAAVLAGTTPSLQYWAYLSAPK
jgi:hypothetical protein